MKYTLIPPEERHKHKCCVCNATESVKYLIHTLIVDNIEGTEWIDRPYCNRCALLFTSLSERNTTK